MMTPEKWERVKDVFDLALHAGLSDRESLLARECAGDRDLRAEIDRLLADFPEAFEFLETPLVRVTEPLGPARPTELAAGDLLSGRFRIVRQIGAGGMGEVYQAEDLALGGQVAIKTMRSEIAADDRTVGRFKREIALGRSVTHPNVCRIYDIASCESPSGRTTTYLTMEMLHGETLATMLGRDGRLSRVAAQPLLCEMAAALGAAHRAGVAHRDFKPSNVMIAREQTEEAPRAVVTDFGVARAIDSPTDGETGTARLIVGTPAYMAPEQLEGQPITPATDIYAFGVVMYEVLTGTNPFPGSSTFSAALRRLGSHPPQLDSPAVDGEWRSLILRCLELDPARRFQNGGELLAGLTALEPRIEAPRMPPDKVRGRWKRRAVFGGVTLAAIISGWLLFARLLPGPQPFTNGQVTFTQLTTLPGQELFPAFSGNDKELVFAGNSGGRWGLFRLTIGEADAIALTPDSAFDNTEPAFSPDARSIAFRSERDGGGVFVIPASGGMATRISATGYLPSWSPDGKSIACSTGDFTRPARGDIGRSRLLLIDVKTGNQRLLNLSDDPIQPNWSPHGNRIAYWRLRNGRRDICTVDVERGTGSCITNDNHVNWNPAWSEDGRFLYFASDRGGSMNLWQVPMNEGTGLTNGEPVALTTPSSYSGYFTISRSGKYLAYAQLAQTSQINKTNFDPGSGSINGSVNPITHGIRVTCCPAPSPDGQWVVFGTGAGHEGIFAMRPDGTEERLLTMTEHRNRQPRWSPRGDAVAFTSNRGGTSEIWSIRPNGGGLRQITSEGGPPIVFAVWSPDGHHLLYDVRGEAPRIIDTDRPWEKQSPIRLPRPDGPNSAFIATSWSANGELLAGDVYRSDGSRGGIFVFSTRKNDYREVTASGSFGVWLRDGRSLLFERGGKLWKIDRISGVERQILTVPGGEIEDDFSLSRDQSTLYFRLTHFEADLWLLSRQRARH